MIVFDDMTRPTPVKDVVPYVLDRLHRAGLEASQIRFIWALGGHGAYDMINARKKLGEKIVENYRRGEITDLYTGPSCLTHEVDIKEAIEHYGLPPRRAPYDIVICNAYGKANECIIAAALGMRLMHRGEGTAVLIADAPEGQVPHYVFRSWETEYGGRHYNARQPDLIPHLMTKLVVLSPSPVRGR